MKAAGIAIDSEHYRAPLPDSSPSTPPKHEDGDNNRGMDIDEQLSDSWWERVKYYARLAIERVNYVLILSNNYSVR